VSSKNVVRMKRSPPIRRWLSACCAWLVFSFVLARPAQADPAAQRYVATVTDDSVKICLSYSGCGSPMLREDSNGGLVELTGSLNGKNSNCYVDDCVPPGTYRYGCEAPLSCACSSPLYFESATVTESVDAACTRRAGNGPPAPLSRAAPWPTDAGDDVYVPCGPVCAFGGCDAGEDSDSGADAGSSKDAGSGGGPEIVSGCGCSSARSVFAFDASVLFLSLGLLLRRRWRAHTP
jgi:hypothetical protein